MRPSSTVRGPGTSTSAATARTAPERRPSGHYFTESHAPALKLRRRAISAAPSRQSTPGAGPPLGDGPPSGRPEGVPGLHRAERRPVRRCHGSACTCSSTATPPSASSGWKAASSSPPSSWGGFPAALGAGSLRWPAPPQEPRTPAPRPRPRRTAGRHRPPDAGADPDRCRSRRVGHHHGGRRDLTPPGGPAAADWLTRLATEKSGVPRRHRDRRSTAVAPRLVWSLESSNWIVNARGSGAR